MQPTGGADTSLSKVRQAASRLLPGPLRSLFDEELPRGVGWPHVLGSSLLALLLVQALTGVLLSLNYSPSSDTAWESVRHIQERTSYGGLVRGIHHWAASAAIVVAALHLIRVFVYAAYRRPRQWTWFVGVLLFLTLLAFGLTGYLLPWDLKAYFGTRVATSIPGSLPVIGRYLLALIRGGEDVGSLTLTRFYALHAIVLPAAISLLVIVHLRLIRKHGITAPWTDVGEAAEQGPTFFPFQAWKDSFAVLLVVSVIFVLALRFGAPLGSKADPNNVTYVPRPDWYFLGLQQLLRIFQGRWQLLGTAIIPGAVVFLLLFLPWLDRNPSRRLSARPIALAAGGVFSLALLWVTLAGHFAVKAEERRLADLFQSQTPARQVAVASTPAPGLVARGQDLYQKLRCGTCHEAGRTEVIPGLPPGLDDAGSKLRPSWMTAYLRRPYPIRWLDENERPTIRMPDFHLSEDEAEAISSFLATRTDEERFPQPADSGFWASATEEDGQRLIREYNCTGCHIIQGEGNQLGPDLTRVGRRLQEAYMLAFLRNPDAIIPGTPMKEVDLWEEEAAAITKFLATLK